MLHSLVILSSFIWSVFDHRLNIFALYTIISSSCETEVLKTWAALLCVIREKAKSPKNANKHTSTVQMLG